MTAAGGVNLHLYPATMTHQSRILRAVTTLEEAGLFDAIHLVGIAEKGSSETPDPMPRRAVWHVPLKLPGRVPRLRTLVFFLEWYARVLIRYWRVPLRVIHCHSVSDLPLGALLKGLGRGRALVYDAHELETERNGIRGLRQRLDRLSERAFVRRADWVLAVSPSIVSWYERRYGRPVALVRNRPAARWARAAHEGAALRDLYGIRGGIVFLCHGALLPGRGISLCLAAFARAPADRHLVCMGYGPLEDEVKAYAKRHANIHFHEPVKPEEIRAVSAGADVGLSIIENTCLSYYYCLPNKLYEYVQAGLAVIVSDFPDMGAEVDRLGNGWKVEVSEEALVALVGRLSSSEVEVRKARSRQAAPLVDWSTEAPVLLDVYRGLGRRP